MLKSDEIKLRNENKEAKENNTKVVVSEEEKQKVKELEYLLQCASAECGW